MAKASFSRRAVLWVGLAAAVVAGVAVDLSARQFGRYFNAPEPRNVNPKYDGRFALADGMALPFPAGVFDLVLSHAVIEHVADAPLYLRECARVLAPGGRVYLSTAPYLSFAGAHLPRLRIPVPLHLLFGPLQLLSSACSLPSVYHARNSEIPSRMPPAIAISSPLLSALNCIRLAA